MNTPDMATYMANLGRAARHASHDMARASTAIKNRALQQLAHEIDRNRSLVLTANGQDLASAHSAGHDSAFIDRLTLTPERIDAMVEGLAQIISLPDPVGEISELRQRPSGIQVGRMRVPLGVIGIIYESRPNVTVDAAALCLKAGNAAILRGGSEAIHSNRTLAALMSESLARTGLPPSAVQLVSMTDRAAVDYLIRDRESVDVIIPRGGRSLIEHISA
ncbi:MAG: aldehyde dehydrogenase family protein, partial [Lautropia mirabilis]|nr:aldehyde dehydrogenase family protein [Lautropia mirabilis]